MKSSAQAVTIVEVGPRDGFQSVDAFIPTPRKFDLIQQLHAAGLRRIETTSFVSPRALPQLADANEILVAAGELADLDQQVLVPTARHAERAIAAGARHLSAVLSVSERHNMGNVRRMPLESAGEYAEMVAMIPAGSAMRLNVATAFDCPYLGRTPVEAVLALLEPLVATLPTAEVALCDTTGRADPAHVAELFAAVRHRYPEIGAWAFHAHDTYGLGAANVLSAWNAGVRIFDAAFAGLGGCPFAPGATGNVATEDLVWMFERMGVATGISLDRLVAAANDVATLPGAQIGGRVRNALAADTCKAAAA